MTIVFKNFSKSLAAEKDRNHRGIWFCNSCGVSVEDNIPQPKSLKGIHLSENPWAYSPDEKTVMNTVNTKNGTIYVVCRTKA